MTTIAAVAAFLFVDGKLLVVRRSEREDIFRGQYEVPGGKLEPGESLHDALARETREETGLAVEPTRELRTVTYTGASGREIHETHYLVELRGTFDVHLSEEHDDWRLVTREELATLTMSREMRSWCEDTFLRCRS